MVRWQYKTIRFNYPDADTGAPGGWSEDFNQLGSSGWELVSVYKGYAYFKLSQDIQKVKVYNT